MDDVVVRRLRADEVRQARDLRLAALSGAPEMFLRTYDEEAAHPEEFWRRRAEEAATSDHVATFVAVEGERHVGTATGLRPDGPEPAELVGMWVEPDVRGRGVGTALVEAVCAWAAERRSPVITLEVREHNGAARRLYERCGFTVTGAPPSGSACELRMERRLPSRILARVQRDAGAPDLFETLSERIPPTDLQSLLLEVVRARTKSRSPADLLAQRRRDRTLPPSPIDARRMHEIAGYALATAGEFEAVALSPVSPAGLNAVLGGVDQNNSLATVRGTEVLADPTTALALEAALRRRAGTEVVRLCSVDRVLRMQTFPEGWRQHFGLFSLLTAGRSEPDHAFELRALREHLRVHLRLLARLGRRTATVEVADTGSRAHRIETEVLAPLRSQFPDVVLRLQPGRTRAASYYAGLMLEILVPTPQGEPLAIADGGMADWTQRLLSSRKERLLVSAIGIELLGGAQAP